MEQEIEVNKCFDDWDAWMMYIMMFTVSCRVEYHTQTSICTEDTHIRAGIESNPAPNRKQWIGVLFCTEYKDRI